MGKSMCRTQSTWHCIQPLGPSTLGGGHAQGRRHKQVVKESQAGWRDPGLTTPTAAPQQRHGTRCPREQEGSNDIMITFGQDDLQGGTGVLWQRRIRCGFWAEGLAPMPSRQCGHGAGGPYAQGGDSGAGTSRLRSGVINF